MGIIENLNYEIIFWLVLLVAFLIGEIISVGLTSIWFAAGSLVSLLIAICDGNFAFQIVVFFVVSFVLLFGTRPWAQKYVNSKSEKTNVDGLIGKRVTICQEVNNLNQSGKAVLNDVEWTVRTDDDKEIISQGELAEILRISGVKLIVKRVKED